MGTRSTKEEFVAKAISVHGPKYDYSKVIYSNALSKVKIICPEHGEFLQTPGKHVHGQGCKACGRKGKSKYTWEEVIVKFKEVHDTKYIYDNVQYTNTTTKIQITCPDHGDFAQTPEKHLAGRGCPKCAREAVASRMTSTEEEFITKSRKVHGDRYDYSKVQYSSSKDKVLIICKYHGEFYQSPNGHLAGYGCKHCSNCGKGRTDVDKECTLYYFNIVGTGLYKIGITSQTIEQRYRTKFDRDQIRMIAEIKYPNGEEAYAQEQKLLKKHTKYKYIGDKIMKSGNTELFTQDVLELDGLSKEEILDKMKGDK